MERQIGPDTSRQQLGRAAGVSNKLDSSLGGTEVAPRETRVALPPPVPTLTSAPGFTMDRHTPGPWKINRKFPYAVFAGTTPVAGLIHNGIPAEDKVPTLRLIAATPGLYAACKELVAWDAGGGSLARAIAIAKKSTKDPVLLQHHPGSWHRNINARYPIYGGEAPNHTLIASMYGAIGSPVEIANEEREANYRVIAASPKLLAACLKLAQSGGDDSDLQGAVDLAKMAITCRY